VQTKKKVEQDSQLSIFAFEDDKLRQRLKEMNIEGMTPLQAFQVLAELISEAKS
jgi:type III secretion system FlhB-like substrate exporter